MRAAGDDLHGRGLRGLVVVLWRAGLRINEALALNEPDLDHRRGSCGAARAAGVAKSAWTSGRGSNCSQWLISRLGFPVGPLFASSTLTRGRLWSSAAARAALRRTAAAAGAALRPTNPATRTPSRWRTRACR
jgi:hypothetical protein